MTDKEVSEASAVISIPGYQFIQLIGAGAGGQVYLTEYRQQQRAVKTFQLSQSDKLQRRFQQEIDILARLNHPGICGYLGSGQTDQGQLYLAMEFIEGSALDQYVSDHSPTLNQRVELIIQCAEIIQYAHEHGVLHRDLKPANILIDKQSRVHILDFGIARLIDEEFPEMTRLTMEGQVMGTLPYMSPEQIQGNAKKITVTSDLYSLGIIAYEMIAGCHPFALHGLSLSDALERVLTAPLKHATSFNPAVAEPLDRILFKAVSRDEKYRYRSASELVDDLKRYQSGKRVQAKGQTTWQELNQIFVRHKFPVITAAVIFLMATVTAGISGWFAYKENKARHQAEIQLDKSRSLSEFLINMLASADPDLGKSANLTVRELVVSTAGNLKQSITDPELEASILCTLGDSLRSLGKYREARQQIQSALKLISRQDVEAYQQCRLAQGLVESNAGERILARKILTELNPAEGSDAWIKIQIEMAVMDGAEGVPKAAMERLQKIIDLPFEILPEKDPQRLIAIHSFATMLQEDGQLEKSQQAMEQVIQLNTEVYGKEHPRTLYSLNNLGTILTRRNQLAEAEEIFRHVIALRSKIYGPEHVRVVNTKMNLLSVLVTAKKYSQANQLSTQLLHQDSRTQLDEEKIIHLMNMRAYLLEDMGRVSEAEKLYRESLQLMQKKKGRTITELMPVRNNLAMLLMNTNRPVEALKEFEILLEGLEAEYGKNHPYYAIIENNYGESLGQNGQIAEALNRLQQSHKLLLKIFGDDHPRVIKSAKRIERLKEQGVTK